MVNAGICNFSICIRVYAPNKKLTKLNLIIRRQLKKNMPKICVYPNL